MLAAHGSLAIVAFAATAVGADDGLRERISCRGLVRARRPGKQICVAHAAGSYRRTEELPHPRLAEHSVEDIGHGITHPS